MCIGGGMGAAGLFEVVQQAPGWERATPVALFRGIATVIISGLCGARASVAQALSNSALLPAALYAAALS